MRVGRASRVRKKGKAEIIALLDPNGAGTACSRLAKHAVCHGALATAPRPHYR